MNHLPHYPKGQFDYRRMFRFGEGPGPNSRMGTRFAVGYGGRNEGGTMQDQIRHYEDKLRYETDSWDLNEARNKGENVVVIDARSTEAYAAERIPGAISLPHRAMDATSTAGLDRYALYVTYCDGIGCNASTKGALSLARLGFTVKELMGGIDWWKRDGYPTEKGAGPAPIGCGC